MDPFRKRVSAAVYYRRLFHSHRGELEELRQILADRRSVETVTQLLRARQTVLRRPEFYYAKASADLCDQFHFVDPNGFRVCGTRNPYFLSEFFRLDRNVVLLDGGAYIGDTIEQLFSLLGGPCKKVYAFEPNPETFQKLEKRTAQFGDLIERLPYGLDCRDSTSNFRNDDAGSRLVDDGEITVRTVDAGAFLRERETEPPTFIKLDIEGKEQDVLRSAADFIRDNRPDLAVSIYHRLEDLWEIPLQLHWICPDYQIYIRHQSNYYTETICYATAGRA